MKPALTRFAGATKGVAILEFALIVPVLLVLAFGAYAVTDYVIVSRKVALTCRTVADLTSKYTSISDADMSTILNASALIIAPYSSSPLSIRLSQVSTDSTGSFTTVLWSKALNTGVYQVGSPYPLPADFQSPNTVMIVGEVSYAYTPKVNYGVAGPFTASARVVMPPRGVDAIKYIRQ